MFEYLKNIIPRLQQYSFNLDRQEVFVDKPWVYIDEQNNHHEYIFERDNKLLMVLNGINKTGSWRLIPANGKLLIDRIDNQIVYQHIFIDEALMILKLSGKDDPAFILINEHKIPDYDVKKYLENYVINIPPFNPPSTNDQTTFGDHPHDKFILSILIFLVGMILIILILTTEK